jgi:hypothetical protein
LTPRSIVASWRRAWRRFSRLRELDRRRRPLVVTNRRLL